MEELREVAQHQLAVRPLGILGFAVSKIVNRLLGVSRRGVVAPDLKRRLVVGRKSDGRSVYDEAAKSELVALCRRPGASVSRLARECGVNANQVSRWLREHGDSGRARRAVANVAAAPSAFVAVSMPATAPVAAASSDSIAAVMDMHARLGTSACSRATAATCASACRASRCTTAGAGCTSRCG
nr:transposase [Paracidovorax cattleyae]